MPGLLTLWEMRHWGVTMIFFVEMDSATETRDYRLVVVSQGYSG